jgi:hypothetical protein
MLARRLERTRGRRWITAAVATLALAGAVSCGHLNTNGRSPSYLVIESLQAASGARPSEFGHILESDVVTNVTVTVGSTQVSQATTYEDLGQISMKMALKDVGNAVATVAPTATNSITVTRYHVAFKRSDGRATEGVDVPYAFDGAATGTISESGNTLSFVLVRAQSKLETPLRALRGGGGAIVLSTIADVTFYGQDQNGNAVSVTGSISVNFADWGDPT